MPAIGDLGLEPCLDPFGLALAAVDLLGDVPLLVRQRVNAGVDNDLKAAPTWPNRWSCP
jgi:hypothetical protein